MKKRIAFAGGGSGGHLYPQVAIAGELKKNFPDLEIFFVSSKGSIEEKLIPKSGYEVVLIPSGKLKGQSPIGLLKTFFSLLASIFVCLKILIFRRPDLIFSAGGYAGAPFLVMGSLLGVRCEILEQNRMPGLANRWMAKFCKRVFVNFSASEKLFPSKEVKSYGHPCRPEIEKVRLPQNQLHAFYQTNPFKIFVFGGSQGAVGINRLVTEATKYFDGLNIQILHQTGELDYERVKADYEKAGYKNARVEKFIYTMAESFAEAHLIICRAGASSLAELAAAQKASILIPLVSKDRHQEFNAQEIENIGAGLCFLQKSLTGETLAAKIKELYNHRDRLETLSLKMGQLHHSDAAAKIAKALMEG